MICPECGSREIEVFLMPGEQPGGESLRKRERGMRLCRCKQCGNWWLTGVKLNWAAKNAVWRRAMPRLLCCIYLFFVRSASQ